MPTLLRLHNPDDIWRGVYSTHSEGFSDATFGSTSRHPCPAEEGHQVDFEDYHGFANEEQLLNWFPHPQRFRHGVVLSIVTVRKLIVLDSQAIFRRDDYISHTRYEGPLQCSC